MNIRQALHCIKNREDAEGQFYLLQVWQGYYNCQKIYHQLRKIK